MYQYEPNQPDYYILLLCMLTVSFDYFVQATVHVSTAYANCNRSTIDERVYRTKLSGVNAIKMANCFDEKTLEQITPT